MRPTTISATANYGDSGTMSTLGMSRDFLQMGRTPRRPDCVAGQTGLELRNVAANYPFERSHRFAGIQPNSGDRDYSPFSCAAGTGAARVPVGDSATLVRDRRLGVWRVGRVLLDAADEIERGVERLVVLRIWRDIGLRAGLLAAFGLEVAAQRCLAARVGARFELLRNLLEHFDVGRDTLRLDRASGRGEVAPAGQPERPIAGAERNDGLHRALAERACANDGRAPVILKRTRHDFGGRGGAAVDQHDDGLVLGEVARARIEPLGFLGGAPARRHDLAPLQEGVGDRDRLVE